MHIISPLGDTILTLTTTAPPTRMLVSSTHLLQVSPLFQNHLTFSDVANHQLTLAGDEPTALLAIMNAIHGRFWAVPGRRIRLELLKDIAMIVDRYNLFDTVCTMVPTWVSTARLGNPRARLHDVAKWFLCVTWVFNQHDMFRFATRELVLESSARPNFAGTCVPPRVASKSFFFSPQLDSSRVHVYVY